jgi:hypothetical protein
VGATDPHPDHLPPARRPFVAPDLGRAERRALLGTRIQPADDLAIARIGSLVYVGIRHGGRCRLTRDQARQLAGSLIELADPDTEETE